MCFWGLTFRSALFFPAAVVFYFPVDEGKAVLTRIEPANSSDDEEGVLGYQYQFELSGSVYRRTSYAGRNEYQTGDSVPIEYLSSNPAISCIKGMRTRPVSVWDGLFGLYFLAIGLFLFICQLLAGASQVRLLKMGALTSAKLINQEVTVDVDGDKQYKSIYEFADIENRVRHIAQQRNYPLAKEQELVLYDPDDISSQDFVEDLSISQEIDEYEFSEKGSIQPEKLIDVLLSSAIPALVIALQIAYLYFYF